MLLGMRGDVAGCSAVRYDLHVDNSLQRLPLLGVSKFTMPNVLVVSKFTLVHFVSAKLPMSFSHAPGSMFITDVPEHELPCFGSAPLDAFYTAVQGLVQRDPGVVVCGWWLCDFD